MAINKLMRIDWRLLEIDLLLTKKRRPLCSADDAHVVDQLSAMPFSMTESEVLEVSEKPFAFFVKILLTSFQFFIQLEPIFHRALGATQRRDPFIEYLYAVFLLQVYFFSFCGCIFHPLLTNIPSISGRSMGSRSWNARRAL